MSRTIKAIALVAFLVVVATSARSDGIAQKNMITDGFSGGISSGMVSSGPQPTGDILLVDGVSLILQTDGASLICRAGGC